MKELGRIILTGATFVAVYFFTFWVPGSLITMGGKLELAMILAMILAVVAAFFAARFVWRRTESLDGGPFVTAGIGAAIVGAIGFIGGFFGPIIFTPDANQGPLLGLFITGPIGVVVGAIGGYFYGFSREQ
ncbi:MAG TPA: hypothetical protein VFI41_12095 [Gemmatimonadales bacterium]|jgi:putative flippase GtrA|nr:hypothetical protein [Gemmatimonadales bacterium]